MGFNKCYEGDTIEVGNLENIEKNDNGIRWFETQTNSSTCRYANSVTELGLWLDEFKPNGKFWIYDTLENLPFRS